MLKSTGALNALNFFMADVRDGLGPFLGVFLQGKGWSPAEIGIVMTIGGLAGMLATAPLGALVDATKAKRTMLVAAAVVIIAAAIVNYFAGHVAVTALAQVASGVAAAAVAPAIAGITLGLVGQAGFPHQLGRNEAFNHAGNATAACLSGVLGYLFGIGAVFVLMTGMAVARRRRRAEREHWRLRGPTSRLRRSLPGIGHHRRACARGLVGRKQPRRDRPGAAAHAGVGLVGHSHAAPRTPPASPQRGGRTVTAAWSEKMCGSISPGRRA